MTVYLQTPCALFYPNDSVSAVPSFYLNDSVFAKPLCLFLSKDKNLVLFFIKRRVNLQAPVSFLSKWQCILQIPCVFRYPNGSVFVDPQCLFLTKWQCICSPLFLSKWQCFCKAHVSFFIKRPEFGLLFLSKWKCICRSHVSFVIQMTVYLQIPCKCKCICRSPVVLLCPNDSVFEGPLCLFYPNASVCTDPLCLSLSKWQVFAGPMCLTLSKW